MIKSILVCTDGSENSNTACEYAIYLAQQLRARLSALHVMDSRMLEGPLMADISGWVGAQPFGAQLQNFKELMEEKGRTIVSAFHELCKKNDFTAEAHIKIGHPTQIILEEETHAELIVLGQHGEHARWSGDMLGSTVEAVVRRSGKPCLVTPQTFKSCSKILAAYDGSSHASRALHEAIELAISLSSPLVILTVAERHDMSHAHAIAEDGMKLARAHECAAAHMVVEGVPETTILTKAEELGCDLIVMGAYGHSRIRQMILGSATTRLIAETHKPLMLVR